MGTLILDGPQVLPVQVAIADVQAGLIESVAGIDRMIASLNACRAEAIAAAHRWAKTTENAVVPLGVSDRRRAILAHRSFVAEIACALRIPERTAENLIVESEMLTGELPQTMAALSQGRIGYGQARVIIDEAYGLTPERRHAFESALVQAAAASTVPRLRARARRVRERLEPESIAARTAAAIQERAVSTEHVGNGMGWLNIYAQAPVIDGIDDRLSQAAHARRDAGDPRTISQLRADIAAALLLGTNANTSNGTDANAESAADGGNDGGNNNADDGGTSGADDGTGTGTEAATGPGHTGSVTGPNLRTNPSFDFPQDLLARIRPQILVTVPVLSLMGITEDPGSLQGCVPIDASTARILAANAPSFIRLLTHPQTEAVLSVGRDSYRPPADLRQWLRIRDGLCRFPGCTRRAVHTEIDHTGQWQSHGPTQYDNLACLCAKHHHLKDQTTWQVRQRDRGTLEWTSPTGRSYTTEPEIVLPTPPTRPERTGSGSDRQPPDREDEAPPF
jgi:hypothetical protein